MGGLVETGPSYGWTSCRSMAFQAALRALLLLPPHGMLPVEALTYSEHSFRHLYVTMGRQLNVGRDGLLEIGHWSANSMMPQHYDSAACTTELQVKKRVFDAVMSGWQLGGAGRVPKEVPQS
eukprot:3540764-Karenia_brevis.AAC.1